MKKKKKNICLRFHMPAIFDAGFAMQLLPVVKKYGDVDAVVTGPMGCTALLDHDLETEIKFVRERWGSWIKSSGEKYDVIINATHTSSLQRLLADCWHLTRRMERDIPFIGIDTNSKTVIPWNEDAKSFAISLAADMHFQMGEPTDFGRTFWEEGRRKYRKILAVDVGDFILINGTVVGKAKSQDITVVEEGGEIIRIRGAEIKKHGREKLNKTRVSLEDAKIDTLKLLRNTVHIPLQVQKRKKLVLPQEDRVAFVNHAGYYIYNYIERGISGAVTVGDDTTSIAGDILSRYSIPIIGLVDGDVDRLLIEVNYAPNSIVLYLANDDSFGELVFNQIFHQNVYIKSKMDELKEIIINLAKTTNVLKRVQYYE
jgi:hypothetical protein